MTPPPHASEPTEDADQDAALLRRAAAGDRAAFEDLYRRLAPPVMSFLYHLTGDRGLAEDATQDVFVKAWRAAGRYDPARAKVRTWLFQIAKNHAWNALPRWRRGRGTGGEGSLGHVAGAAGEATAPSSTSAAEGGARREEVASALKRAMDGLSETLRAVFVLVRIESRSYAEVAEVLDIPLGTVKSRMSAAETYLRERLRGVQ